MINEKKVWLCEQYAQKAWALSLNLAQEAARAGHYGRGYAVIADETRIIANSLFNYAVKTRFDGGGEDEFRGIVDLALELGFLSVNAMLEILHVEAMDDKINSKSVAVCAEEVRNLSLALNELGDKKLWQKPFVLPEIVSPLKSTKKTDFFFRFSIGNNALVENTLNVQEVYYSPKTNTAGETFSLRGYKIPIINCYKKFGLSFPSLDTERQTVIIINPDDEKHHDYMDGTYAVLADDLDINTIFRSRIGYAVPPKKSGVFAEYSRECWDVIGNEQLLFIDWQKLIPR